MTFRRCPETIAESQNFLLPVGTWLFTQRVIAKHCYANRRRSGTEGSPDGEILGSWLGRGKSQLLLFDDFEDDLPFGARADGAEQDAH